MNGPAAARQAGITYRQLDYWTHQSYLHAVRAHGGSGYEREYDDVQVRRAWMMGHLVTAGLTALAAYVVSLQLEEHHDGVATLGRVISLRWMTCELCDGLLAPGQIDVHPECLEAEQSDVDNLVWYAHQKPIRRVENVPDDERRFS